MQVSHRARTTSTGDRPTNSFPSVAVGEGGGVNLTGYGFLTSGAGCLREAVEAFLERSTPFLRVAGAFGEAYFATGRRIP